MIVAYRDLAWEHAQLAGDLGPRLAQVAASGRYLLGPELDAFEAEFAAYTGTRHCVGLGSGTEALRLTLVAWGIGPGDEVIVPAHTAVATWLAVAQAGATPVPVEVDLATFTLDATRLGAALTRRTRAVIPVHLYGHPADMAPIMDLARQAGIRVLEDASQAHGAHYHGAPAGSLGDAAAWSFYPTKNLGAFGDAGAVTTDDGDLANCLRAFRHPRTREAERVRVAASGSRLDEIQAAVLRAKLARLDAWNSRRRAIAATYLGVLNADGPVVAPAVAAGVEPVWHAFVVRSAERDRLRAHLGGAGIETVIHYPTAPGAWACFAGTGPRPASDAARQLAAEVLSLPLGPELGDEAVNLVLDALLAFDG